MNQPETKWFARVLGRELGPMSRDRLQRMLQDGEITADDEIRCADDPDWSSADSLVVPDRQRDLVTLEPMVSTIAPLRIPKRASEQRVREIRLRAMAARDLRNPETEARTAIESEIDQIILTDEPADQDDSANEFSDAQRVNVSDPDHIEQDDRIAVPSPRPATAGSVDAVFQAVGRAFRARWSRLQYDGPTLREGLAGLFPLRYFNRANAVLAIGVLVICGIAWLLIPGFQSSAFHRLVSMRTAVQSALDGPTTARSNAMQQLRPDIAEIVERLGVEATSENPPGQVLFWAASELHAVVDGSGGKSKQHLTEFDRLIDEYSRLTGGEDQDQAGTGIVELPGGLR